MPPPIYYSFKDYEVVAFYEFVKFLTPTVPKELRTIWDKLVSESEPDEDD